jgi:hypothetical protein
LAQAFVGMLSFGLLLKLFNMTTVCFYVAFCLTQCPFAAGKILLQSYSVDFEVRIFFQSCLIEAWAGLPQRFFKEMDFELEAEILLLDLVNDLERGSALTCELREERRAYTFSCSLKVIKLPASVKIPVASLFGKTARGVDWALLLVTCGIGVASPSISTELPKSLP